MRPVLNVFDGLRRFEGREILAASWAGVLVLAAASSAGGGEPYIPANDDEVLETLPRDLLSNQDDLLSLRQQLSTNPNDSDLATQVASRYMQIGKSSGDPRYYGYARSALRPWWEADKAPTEILRVRAKLKERDHRYDEALADLKLLLNSQPHDLQAWIEAANIYVVQGKYSEARHACDMLSEFAGAAPTVICNAPILAVTGRAEEAYSSLANVLPTVREQWPAAVEWVRTMQAEISRALGDDEQAERHYREGLASQPDDYYLLRSYADFLLDRSREKEVLMLLREHAGDTGILLRAAIAADRLGQRGLAGEWTAQLKSRFDECRLRGDPPHGQFEARFELELMNNPQRALELAQANWRQQKEPRDSRVLLEASIAAKNAAAARPVLAFLKKHSTQDVDLARWARRLEPH